MGPHQGVGLTGSAPTASIVLATEHATATEAAESATPYDVSVEQAGPYRGNALATAPPRDSTEDIDLDLGPDDSLALPPPPIRTAAAPGWHARPPPEGRAHDSGADTADAAVGESRAADGEAAGGGRARSTSDDQESPSKRSSALDVTGAAIIKSVPGEGTAPRTSARGFRV